MRGKLHVNNGTMSSILLVLWITFLVGPSTVREYRAMMPESPWYEATLEILADRPDENGDPSIAYTKTASRVMDGRWSAWIEAVGEAAVFRCGASGDATYRPQFNGVNVYSLNYFLGIDCPRPPIPYRVCAEWRMTHGDGYQLIGPVCSAPSYTWPTTERKGETHEPIDPLHGTCPKDRAGTRRDFRHCA